MKIHPWLLGDTKRFKEVAESMFDLATMVCIGVEFLSKFRYATDQSNVYSPFILGGVNRRAVQKGNWSTL